jgi:hypothetical protein
MKRFGAILLILVLMSSGVIADEQSSVKRAVTELSRDGLELRRSAKEIPACVLQALRRWMHRPFAIVNSDESFPPVTDIRHSGDGRFRLFFFSELSPETTLVCFEDDASLGISQRAFFFSKRGNECVVKYQFALRRPVRSIKEVRAAIIESVKR